jgi:hypothetical protein
MDLPAPEALTLAAHVVTEAIPGSDGPAAGRLDAVAPGNGEALLHLLAAAVATGYARGQAAQAPADDRVTLLANALRGVHQKEVFGDCTEDGDPFPCRTIRALDIVAGPPSSSRTRLTCDSGPHPPGGAGQQRLHR